MKTYIKFLITGFLKSFINIFFIMLSLVFILNILKEIEFFNNSDVNSFYPLYLSILSTPSIIFEMFPFIFLVSTQFFFIKLFNNNEINIFKYSGLKNIQIIKILCLISFLLSIFIITLFYNFSSNLQSYYLQIKNQYSEDNKYLAVINNNGLWIKDVINENINIVNSSKVELVYQDIDVFSKINKQEGILSSVFRDTKVTNFFQKAYENFNELDEKRVVEVSNKILIQPSNKNDLEVTDIKITNKKISFFTNNPGELHLIKVSYFPNWSISNGLGPFRTSPSFMSVIPNEEYVEINFEKTTLEKNSFYFSIFSLVLSLIIFIRSIKNVKKT